MYEFETRSDEVPPEPLGEGIRKYFFNCTYDDSNIPEELIHFYEFVRTGNAEDALTEDLKHAVEVNRMNYIYRSDYLRMREMTDDAKDEGREEGLKSAINVIRQLKNSQLTVSEAAVKLNISEEEVLELLK